MKLIWVAIFTLGVISISSLLMQGMKFTTFAFTALHDDRSFGVSFELPIFDYWQPVVREAVPDAIVIDYVSLKSQKGYNQNDVGGTIVLRKAERTTPLSIEERNKMLGVRGRSILYSIPNEDEEKNRATTLIEVRSLPGFYILEAPINLVAPCDLEDTTSIARAVLTSLAPEKNYRDKGNVELTARFLFLGEIQWPSQIESCSDAPRLSI